MISPEEFKEVAKKMWDDMMDLPQENAINYLADALAEIYRMGGGR